MKHDLMRLLVSAALLGLTTLARAQTYSIDWFTIAGGGGGTSAAQGYSLSGTISQTEVGATLRGGDYTMESEFWSLPADVPLRLSAVEKVGNDLRLTFNALPGTKYVVQSRADLLSGTWTTLPDSTTSATSNTLQITLTNALSQPQQFYRVQQLP